MNLSIIAKPLALLAAVLFLSLTVLELEAQARAGGSRSFGSRGTRSYARPASPSYSQPSPARPQASMPAPAPYQQNGGGFMRSMAGGIMGGMLGSMLFSGMAGAGAGPAGMGHGGIGLFDILLLAGIGYLLFRFLTRRKQHDSPFRR